VALDADATAIRAELRRRLSVAPPRP
jgi:hypothetical protein